MSHILTDKSDSQLLSSVSCRIRFCAGWIPLTRFAYVSLTCNCHLHDAENFPHDSNGTQPVPAKLPSSLYIYNSINSLSLSLYLSIYLSFFLFTFPFSIRSIIFFAANYYLTWNLFSQRTVYLISVIGRIKRLIMLFVNPCPLVRTFSKSSAIPTWNAGSYSQFSFHSIIPSDFH